MKLIISGPPGSGKGTRASRIAKSLRIPHISTGDLFRKEIADGTDLGKNAKTIIDQGKLVPDEITTSMLKKRLQEEDCKNGFILDGFPRTINQAELLGEITDIHHFLNLEISREMIIERISSRRTCKGCGTIFNVKSMPPKVEGKCDHCSSDLVQRDDEKQEVITQRLEVYENQTKPLIQFYSELGLLRALNGEIPVENQEFWNLLKDILKIEINLPENI
jgi:adenylate kinase